MPKPFRSVFVSELVRRDQEFSGYDILSDEVALRALCSQLGIRTPNRHRPFALISDDDVRIKKVTSNAHGGQDKSYYRVPLFVQEPVTGQSPVTQVRHNLLLQRSMVVRLPRLKPYDPNLQDKLTNAVAARLWESVRSRRETTMQMLGLATTAGVAAGVGYAMYSQGVEGEWAMSASAVVLSAGMVGTLHLAEACKPELPELPPGMSPALAIVDRQARENIIPE